MEDRGASDTRLDPERAKRYRIDDDLEALREEVGIIDTAGSLSPATCYDSGITEAVGDRSALRWRLSLRVTWPCSP